MKQISQTSLDLEEIMKDLEEHRAAIVLSTRYIGTLEDTNLDCSISAYRTLLDEIQELQESERVEVLTLSKLYETRLQTYMDANQEDDSYIEELEQKEEELQELKEEWDVIFKEKNSANDEEEETENVTTALTTEEEKTKEESTEEETTSKEKLNADFSAKD